MAALTGTGALVIGAATLSGSVARHYTASGALSIGIPEVSGQVARAYTGTGALIAPAVQLAAVTNVPDPTIWDTDNQPWGSADFVYAANKPVLIIGNEFYQADRDLRFGETPLRCVLMRSGLTIFGKDRFGNWKSDPTSVKIAQGVWPIIRGVPGTRISVYLGAQDSTDEPLRWDGPYNFIVGVSRFCDLVVSGVYLAVRFESQDAEPWELLSYDLDLEIVGERA